MFKKNTIEDNDPFFTGDSIETRLSLPERRRISRAFSWAASPEKYSFWHGIAFMVKYYL